MTDIEALIDAKPGRDHWRKQYSARRLHEIYTPEAIGNMISYDAGTGILTWKPRPREMFTTGRAWRIWNVSNAGREALFSKCQGYKRGTIFGKAARAHRIAWCLYYGEWPKGQVDHINGDRSDNRIANLRDVDALANARNRGIATNNSSGVLGVIWHKATGKWYAFISVSRKTKSLGLFNDIEDAIKARREAESALGFHVMHGQRASVAANQERIHG